MEHMFGIEYVQGYTAALLDVKRVLREVSVDFQNHHIKRTPKEYDKILDCMIENRAVLREEPGAFVRHNKQSQNWEVYIEK